MRIFITGGNGQLGLALAMTLNEDELYLGRHETEDITDPRIIQTISDFNPEAIIHAAAMTDVDTCELKPDQAFLVNEQGTRNVAEGARQTGAIMVYISTDYVFDGSKKTPYIETDPVNPVNLYGMSKLKGERATQEGTDRWLIIRTSWVYGIGRKNFVTNVLEWAKKEPFLRLVKDKVGAPTYANDLASAIRYLLNSGITNTIIHASGEGECNWAEYGREILTAAGIEKEIQPITFNELHRPAKRPSYSVLKNGILEEAGFKMRPWQSALEDFLRTFYL